MNKPISIKWIGWLVTVLVPIAVTLSAGRLIGSPLYLNLEYNTPGFPADPYGFTKQERLLWSTLTLDYLYNSADISYFDALRFEDGTPVYNERELVHMVDVKQAMQAALWVWYVSLGLLVGIGVWAWRADWLRDYRLAISRGGFLTVILLISLLILVLLAWNFFFVAFHNILFKPGTWTFYYSDTFIRLFPERFWRDLFLYIGILTVAGGLALGYAGRPRK